MGRNLTINLAILLVVGDEAGAKFNNQPRDITSDTSVKGARNLTINPVLILGDTSESGQEIQQSTLVWY